MVRRAYIRARPVRVMLFFGVMDGMPGSRFGHRVHSRARDLSAEQDEGQRNKHDFERAKHHDRETRQQRLRGQAGPNRLHIHERNRARQVSDELKDQRL